MSPTRRIATILTVATVTLAGAGFALASVGGTTTTDAQAAAPAASSEATTDPAVVRALTQQLSQLDSRSNKLRKLLDGIRGKSHQVSQETDVVQTQTSSYGDEPAPAPAPVPATTQNSDDGYENESSDDGYENESSDDGYENESSDDDESESESHDD